jgi:putative methionine-R-sulfoxide reductase with GAF domain
VVSLFTSQRRSTVYVENVDRDHISESSKLGDFGEVNYLKGHDQVRSELAMPVEADGVRVGVLDLESNLVGAFSEHHVFVARRFAERAGRVWWTPFSGHENRSLLDRGRH